MELTPWTGKRIGLEPRQVAVIILTHHHFNRQQIGSLLHLGKQNVRDILGGMCDQYECPASDLYGMALIELEALAEDDTENSEIPA